MKNWVLMFCFIFFAVAILPFSATKATKERPSTKLTVFEDEAVLEIDVEEYALRVLLGEGEICESFESKKALAVAARTLGSYFSLYGCKHEEFSACADGNCCLKLGDCDDYDEGFLNDCKAAVSETKGEILTLDRLPALTLFTLCSGSGTAQSTEFSYLSPTSNTTVCEKHVFSQVFDKTGIFENTNANNSFVVYSENEKCDFLILNGKKFDAHDFITQTGIKSCEFKLWFDNGKIFAETKGVGHGFGLDLCGAERMAKNGSGYKEILGFYYPRLILNNFF